MAEKQDGMPLGAQACIKQAHLMVYSGSLQCDTHRVNSRMVGGTGSDGAQQAGSGAGHPEAVCSAVPSPLCEAAG